MVPYRCRICGETYLGNTEPDRCPFCGAAGRHLVSAPEWERIGKIEMAAESRDYCRKALDLEISNVNFYKACAVNAETVIAEAIFKRLSKHETEHAEVFARMLGIDIPESREERAPESDSDKFAEAHARESRAIKFYLEAAEKVKERRVAEVFRALSDVESEHLKISNLYR